MKKEKKAHILDTYAGYSITYDAGSELFVATNPADDDEYMTADERTITADTMKAVRAKIDNRIKEPKLKQPKQEAIAVRTRGYLCTSEEKNVGAFGYVKRWYSQSTKELYAWVSDRNGRNREREDFSERYSSNVIYIEDTADNRAILEVMQAKGKILEAQEQELLKELAQMTKKLTRIQPKVELDKLPTWN